MPNKKRQPFYFFMLEVQKKQRERGKHYSLQEMPAIASPIWASMSKEEKAKYEEQAKRHNGQLGSSSSIKTCHGIDYTEVEREQRQAAKQQKTMKEDVRQMIKQAILAQKISSKTYFVIHINYFCQSRGSDGEPHYDAAELAILDFSLEDGIKRGMHTFMKLDTLPYGYSFEATRHTNDTHQLPLPPDTIGQTTIREAVLEVINFISEVDDDVCPPIFTFDDHIPVVRSIFDDVLSQLATANPGDVRIYSLSELLFHLKAATHSQAVIAAPQQPFASVFLAESYLERGTFDYAEGLPCEYHQEIDRVPNCSQTKIKGWAFSIIRSCAPDLGITFMEGKHEPMNTQPTPQPKIRDDESVFTATDLTSEANRSNFSHSAPIRNPWGAASQAPTGISSTANTSSYFNTTKDSSFANTDDFPLLRDIKRGKGRGNLL
ncbi:protein maelstrom homolog [Lutzomyia longipalpis]|nr:protein maelstrom homolog [Lutzomyia longipalpis]